MRGLHTAGVLLAPALAGAISLEGEDSIPRAFINVRLPEPVDSNASSDLVFRFDVNESQDACGYGNVTINGRKLSEDGHGSLNMYGNRVVDASWNLTCVTWNDKPNEQLLNMKVENVNGQAVEDVGFTLRFQQVAPVWISDVEGGASMTRVHSSGQGQSKPHDANEGMDLDSELAELDYLRWQMAELAQLIHAKEHRLAKTFGWKRPHWQGPRIHECDSLKPHRGPGFIHIASGIASLVLVVIFGSVLYQRHVRKSIRPPRLHRSSNVPWYKRLCFGPNYSELSEDEEKEAMLRNCGDSDSDDEDDSGVVARDISQFRTAADVVGEMVAAEDARMAAHSRQPSFSPAPAAGPVEVMQPHRYHMQQQPMHPYIPSHLIPGNSIPMTMPTGQLSPDPATMAAMAAMFPDLAADYDMELGDHTHHHGGVVGAGMGFGGEELPAYQEADRRSEDDESEIASSVVTDGYRPGCSGSSYTPSESGSQGASDILGNTKN
ncbi:hypothetical protein KVR01_003597 [Diaporthe batatas]|uniref:uncharacterized protein n=1 Tax=Diaporthe batatas TaxID=748121 RepID=UPI001D043D86|nr:uncharacterized protein KVR01_003597 [Diaporthe batatas]KAG8167908.1 hypothetical protein KVR01_003597 [Diaporthe batatas]